MDLITYSYWEYILPIQYIPRNMHTVFILLCFVVVILWLIFPYLSGLLHWHCGNLTIAPVPAKQAWWIWINTSCEFIMNDCITTTKQSTTKPCAYFLGYTVLVKRAPGDTMSSCIVYLVHWQQYNSDKVTDVMATSRSHESSKPWDMDLNYSDRAEILNPQSETMLNRCRFIWNIRTSKHLKRPLTSSKVTCTLDL